MACYQLPRLLSLSAFTIVLVGCAPSPSPESAGSSDTEMSESSSPTALTETGLGSDGATASEETDTGSEGGEEEAESTFLPGGDLGSCPPVYEGEREDGKITRLSCACSPWAQDCPEGEKCAPYFFSDEVDLPSTRCVPVSDSPRESLETCTRDANDEDDCVVGSSCLFVDSTGIGVCIPHCEGSLEDPTCPEPSSQCNKIEGEPGLFCETLCDPEGAPCPHETTTCVTTDEGFACRPSPL